MEQFSYTCIDQDGRLESGQISATDETQVFQYLHRRGLTAIEISPGQDGARQTRWYRRDIDFSARNLPLSAQVRIAEQLAVLFEARVPLTDALRLLRKNSKDRKLQAVLDRVSSRVEDGSPLGDAFQGDRALFHPLFLSALRTSDSTNSGHIVLPDLARSLRSIQHVRGQVLAALVYPTILVAAAGALVLILSLFLAPNLLPIFEAADRSPPALIAALHHFGVWIAENWTSVIGAVVAVGLLFVLFTRSKRGKRSLRRALTRLPVVGRLLLHTEFLNVLRAIELLLRSGVQYSVALRESAKMDPEGSYNELLEEAAASLEQGQKASDVFETSSAVPSIAREVLRIAEETNRLTSALTTLSAVIKEENDRAVQSALQALVPILTILIGVGVGALIYAVMGAILEVNLLEV